MGTALASQVEARPFATPPAGNYPLAEIVEQSRELYSLPSVVVEILSLTSRPTLDSAELRAAIERDPAMVAKILRVANSSLFGLATRVTDLQQAVALLGIKPLKLLVLGFSLPDDLTANVAGDVLGRYWRHTLTRAVAAREISQRLCQASGDEAFIVGLLADLGMLVLIQGLGEPYIAFLRRVFEWKTSVAPIERRTMGFDHQEVTARLLSQWGLPESIVEVVRSAGREDSAASSPMLEVLRLAELMATLLADEQTEALRPMLESAAERMGMEVGPLAELAEVVERRVEELAHVLAVDLPVGRTYANVLAEAHSQLSRTAAEAAESVIRSQSESLSARLDQFMLLDEVRSVSESLADWTPKPRRVADTAKSSSSAGDTPRPRAKAKVEAAAAPQAPVELSHAGFMRRIGEEIVNCRQSRAALSLWLVEVSLNEANESHAELGRFVRAVEHACALIDHPAIEVVRTTLVRLAVILPSSDRVEAVNLCGEFLRSVAALRVPEGTAPRVAVGVATVALPPKNFPIQDLVAAADRCLHAATLSGGNCLKSIEIY